MGTTKKREKARLLLYFVIKECFDAKDESRTRLNARRKIRVFFEETEDYELRALASRMLNEMSFEDLTALYNEPLPEDNNMEKEKATELFDTIVKGKDGELVTVYLNGDEDEEVSCKKIKTFRFEESFYVLLQNTKDNASNYYRYVYEMQDGKPVEKLIGVKDEQQVSLFKFLGY